MLLFVSGSWAADPGEPRELLALNADGSKVELLTACAQARDALRLRPGGPLPEPRPAGRHSHHSRTPKRARARSTSWTSSRSVETLIFPNRRIDSVDYSPDGSFIIYSAIVPQTTQEDLFYSLPNGQEEQNLTQSLDLRERSARIDPFAARRSTRGSTSPG